MKQQDSPAIQLLQMVWDHCQEATGHSWLKLNHAMSATLSLAVRSGMRFDEDDFDRICRNSCDGGFRAGYWVGSDTEWFYRLAVLYRNASAWQTYEQYCGRKPFIVKGAGLRHGFTGGDGPAGHGLSRLIVGAEFAWKGERVKVNSFNDEKGYFNAASYQRVGEMKDCSKCGHPLAWPEDAIHNRYKITHADLRAEKAKKKEEAAA